MARLSTYFPDTIAQPLYAPALMEFDGSTGYYNLTGVTTSGNGVAVVCRFACASFTGGGIQRLFQIEGSSPSGDLRAAAIMYSSDNADADRAGKILVQSQNTAGTNIARLISPSGFIDGQPHTLFYSFDGDAGSATFIIDGLDADDTGNADRIAPTTGTLDAGATGILTVGNDNTNYFKGEIGFFGWRDAYLTNWQDFMTSEGQPKRLDTSGWSQWGSQPLFWNENGDMENNRGSAGAMTKNGTIEIGTGVTYSIRRQKYTPAMMEYDQASSYDISYTSAGNKTTMVARIKCTSWLTDYRWVVGCEGPIDKNRGQFAIGPDDAATVYEQGRLIFYATNSAGTEICRVVSNSRVDDGVPHTVFASYDGDNGLVTFIIDGVDEDNTGAANRVLTTGTMSTGASSYFSVGNQPDEVVAAKYFEGEVGFVGLAEDYLTNWGDFMDSTGEPYPLDEVNWTEWGGQPLFWNPHGDMENNRGSAGNMTKNGTISVSDGAIRQVKEIARYTPAMMEFDGSTGYYNNGSITTSGNKFTLIARFNVASFGGGEGQRIASVVKSYGRIYVTLRPNDHATASERDRLNILVQSSTGTTLCSLFSDTDVTDGSNHMLFFSFDGDNGTAVFKIDGVDADDTSQTNRTAPTTGTLDSGASTSCGVGADFGGWSKLAGAIGFVGYRDAYLTNWSDFMDANGNPKALDESGWSEWGAQPLFWNPHGFMEDNRGSAGNMTRNGTITIAD